MRSLLKPLAFLYVAVQLLLAMPAGAAAPTGTSQAACEHMGGLPAHDDHCPCCPDGTSSMKDCLASCTLAASMPMSSPRVVVSAQRMRVAVVPAAASPRISEPPLKPPPIA